MGNVRSFVLSSSLALGSVYFFYIHIYRSHKRLQTNVLCSDRFPSLLYLYFKFWSRAAVRRAGCLHTGKSAEERDVVYTVINCRVQSLQLRTFCVAAGYGWDYPDTEFRDVPLCFPEFLCGRLLLLVLTHGDFRLSPAGLVRVTQSLKTLQPVDELKKGPFTLRARVLEYRQVEAGVEVDISLSANSRTGSPVWENVLTLLSKEKFYKPRRENKSPPDESVSEGVRQVELRGPWTPFLQCPWPLCEVSPCRLLSLPARIFGCGSPISPGLWMLSVCLAEIEKHKGVEVITAPVNITAHFKEPLVAPRSRVTVRFWDQAQASPPGLHFQMRKHGSAVTHLAGMISRS